MARCLLLAGLLLYFVPAHGQLVTRDETGNHVRLSGKDCVAESVLKYIPPQLRTTFKSADAKLNGVDYKACWAPNSNQTVLVVFDDGDIASIPNNVFKRETGI